MYRNSRTIAEEDVQFYSINAESQPLLPKDEPQKVGGSHPTQAYLNTVTSFLGVGIYTLPYAFKLMGLYSGIICMLLLSLACMYVIYTLIEGKHLLEEEGYKAQEVTYSALGERAFGKIGQYLIATAVVSSQLGFCCSYLIFIGNTLFSIFETNLNVKEFIAIILPVVLLLCFLRDLKYLSPVSFFANAVFITTMISLFVYGFRDFWHPEQNEYDFFRNDWPIGFGNAVFTMSGVNLAIPIESSLTNRAVYPKVMFAGISTVAVLYLTVGSLGYVFFGDDVTDNVIQTLLRNDPGNLYVIVLNGLLAVQIVFTYPLQMFPVVQMAESTLFPPNQQISWLETKRNIVRLFLVGLTALLATSIPYFSLMSALVGAFATSLSIFIAPTLIHARLFRENCSAFLLIVDALVCLLGLAGAGVSSYYIILEIITCFTDPDSVC